jgi:hypothetical protein
MPVPTTCPQRPGGGTVLPQRIQSLDSSLSGKTADLHPVAFMPQITEIQQSFCGMKEAAADGYSDAPEHCSMTGFSAPARTGRTS